MNEPTWEDVPRLVVEMIKRAEFDGKGGGYLKPVSDTFASLQRTIGGPNPLAATIVGGLATAGIGHVAGSAVGHFMPPRAAKETRRAFTLAGGALGAMPGLAWYGINRAAPEAAVAAPINPTGSAGVDREINSALSGWPFAHKQAAAGSLSIPSIPVDAFNRAVWSDVAQPPNPWGAKSPWGDNSQELRTPPPVAAAISGIVAGAGAMAGTHVVSPIQVGLAAAAAGGKGYAVGLAVGRTLGALAGMDDREQAYIRQIGLWGGVLTSVSRQIFG